jgi:hypothetical protein
MEPTAPERLGGCVDALDQFLLECPDECGMPIANAVRCLGVLVALLAICGRLALLLKSLG